MFYLFLIVTILTLIYIIEGVRKPSNYPPGPTFIPLIGHFWKVRKLSKSLGGLQFAFDHLAKKFKTNVLGLSFGNNLIVVVSSFSTIKYVFTEDVFTGRPKDFFMSLRSMGKNNGITGTDGQLWKIHTEFVSKKMRNLGYGKENMNFIIQEEIFKLMDVLPHNVFSIKKFFSKFVLNVLWIISTGSELTENDPIVEQLIDILLRRSKAFDMAGGLLNVFPWLRYICPKLVGYDLINNLNFELRNFLMETIKHHKLNDADHQRCDLISSFLEEIEKGRETFTEDQLVMVLVDLFIGGSQTTSTTLDFAFMIMIMRPDIQEKIQNQLDVAFDITTPIEYSEKSRVPYVEATLMEVLRYFDIAPIVGPRRALHDTELNGYFIPKNTTILMNLYALNHDPTCWKDPESFRPERFLDENNELTIPNHFLPFGSGKRRCLGEILARNCIFTFFTEIMRHFKVTLHPKSENPSMIPNPGIIVSPKPYIAQFTRRLHE